MSHTIPYDIRESPVRAKQGLPQHVQFGKAGRIAARAELIVVDKNGLRIGIKGFCHLTVVVPRAEVAGDQNIGSLIVAKIVVEYFHLVIGVDKHT